MPADNYSIKEVVDLTRKEQAEGFSRVEVLLSSKADKADLVPINQRLDEHDGHIRSLQDRVLVDTADDSRRARLVTNAQWAVGVGVVVVATVTGFLLNHFFH